MLISRLWVTLSWVLAISAQNVIPTLSFGSKGTISHNSFSIPHWVTSGEQYMPQLLSDKVILTPPYGGNKRGALWTEDKNTQQDWEVNFDFRVGGPDHGKGNLAMWYVKDSSSVATSSIYAVGKFEGLALMIDQNNGVQKVRGFLNDGTTQYRTHQNVDGLAFGHCDYSYRNLGRPSKIRVRSTSGGLDVSVDGNACFSTTKVILPANYYFGLTAASADPPDSIEVFRFETSSTSATTGSEPHQEPPVVHKIMKSNSASANAAAGGSFSSSDAAYQNFNQRLNLIEKSLTNMFSEINQHTKAEEARFNEILQLLKSGQSTNAAGAGAAIGNVESRLSNLDRLISTLSADIRNTFDHDEKFAKISQQLHDTTEGLGHLPTTIGGYVQRHTPRIGFIVFSFMAFQSCCLAFLLWQKYRKGTMPKKFL